MLLAVLYALLRLVIDLLILSDRPTADRDLELLNPSPGPSTSELQRDPILVS